MRIRRPQQDSPRPRLRERMRADPGLTRPLLLAVLGVAVVIAIGVWFSLEGHKAAPPLLRALQRPRRYGPNALPTLRLEIGDRGYRALATSRQAALRGDSLSLESAEWVDARIELEGEVVPAQLRLAGDSAAHWRQGKWSLQARTQGDVTLKGMHLFRLQSPATLNFLDGWLYTAALRRAGVLAPRFSFFNLSVNGDDWGAYALLEGESEEMMEAQGRRNGVIAGFEGSSSQQGAIPFDEGWGVDAVPAVITRDEVKYLAGDAGEQADAATLLLRAFQRQQLAPSEVFDAQAMGKYLAHANLWGARGALAPGVQHYLSDPATQWLEPIAPAPWTLDLDQGSRLDLAHYDDPVIMEAYAQEVLRISRPEYLEGLRAAFGGEFEWLRAVLMSEFDPADLTPPWVALAERQATLAAALRPLRPVHAYLASGYTEIPDPDSTMDLRVANLTPYPVVLRQLRARGSAFDVRVEWVPPGSANGLYEEAKPAVVLRSADGSRPDYVSLHIPSSLLQPVLAPDTVPVSGTLQVVAHVVGADYPVAVEVLEAAPDGVSRPFLPAQPSLAGALARYPFLAPSAEPGYLELKPGTWYVEGDLVLPDRVGLLAMEPATLEFDRSAVLYATGPLVLRAPGTGGIRLIPKEGTWAGIYVAPADPALASALHNVEIAGTAGIQRAGWSVAAGTTFQGGPVTFERCRVVGSIAGVALSVVNTSFAVVETEFAYNSGDALVAEFAQGAIRQSTFHDILGTAIDLGATELVMEDVTLLRCLDRGINAGQESTVAAEGTRIDNAGIAVASTDGSDVSMLGTRLSRASTAAFAAYRTDPEKEPASIGAGGVVFEDDLSQAALVQEGSRIIINGEDAPSGEFDPDMVYRRPSVRPSARAVSYGFGPAIRLAGYGLSGELLVPGDPLQVVLYWQAVEEVNRDYTVFIHLLDRSGRTVAQRDSMPRDNTLPTSQWSTGKVVDDVHSMTLPGDLPPGEYGLALGIYYWETMERLPVLGPDGELFQEGVLILDEAIRVGE